MELCLVSCNIRFDNPADEINAWSHRRLFLAETILKHRPDIIATQEGRFDQLKDLEQLLPGYKLVDQHRSWIKERMYPTIFMKEDKFEFIKSEDIWLSETPEIAGSRSFESAFPRLMTWMKIQPKGAKKAFVVVNTHLDHVKRETRVAQAKVLSQEIKKVWKSECPIFIMGDFNDSPESNVRKVFIQEFPGIQDSWGKFNTVEETSHHHFKGEMPNGSRIDWILADAQIKLLDCLMDKSSRDGKYPTDHFPVICRISL